MRIAVLGAGVIGITTAYFLARSGHKVVIIDRQSGAAKECSHANAAQLSYCNAQPWSNRGALMKGIKWLGKTDAPMRFRMRADYAMWKWLIQFVANCTEKKESENTKHILDFCLYSKSVMQKHGNDFDFDFNYKRGGKIFVFEEQSAMDSYQKQCQIQEVMGAPYQVLSFDELLGYEPNLAHMRNTLVGAIRDPLDDTGDCYQFCVGLENKLKEMGAEFHYETTITGFKKNKKHISAVITDKGEIAADTFVFSLGAYSSQVSKMLGFGLPIHPLKGYSITVDIEDENSAPTTSITYQKERAVFSKLGNKLRVSGTAEFAGYNHDITPERIEMLKRLTRKVFPNVGNIDAAAQWACLRPCTPDFRPIIGESKYDNLILNTGHGSLGWTMCFSTAKLITDIVNGKETEIDIKPFAANRFIL